MPTAPGSTTIELEDFFSAAEARTDRWRQMAAAGRSWEAALRRGETDESSYTTARGLLSEVSALEEYWAYPGGRLMASLNEALGLERNHYDRLVHFCYGLCFAYPIRELFLRITDVKGVWGYLLPLDVAMSTSMIYELIEWGAAIVFGGEVGQSYLGTQGDEWDAHADMALATLGAMLTIALTFAVNAGLRRDFARELTESLRVKHPEPLGEERLEQLLGERARPER